MVIYKDAGSIVFEGWIVRDGYMIECKVRNEVDDGCWLFFLLLFEGY